jgi:hypothetical protein
MLITEVPVLVSQISNYLNGMEKGLIVRSFNEKIDAYVGLECSTKFVNWHCSSNF